MISIQSFSTKRFVDLVVSLAAIPPALIVSSIVAVAIKFEDRGPILFRQERIGKDALAYHLYKFRSMTVDAPVILTADGSTMVSEKDHRVTRVGRFIRSTSIDELPQMINVLKGEMSWVGPRPSLISALDTYSPEEMRKFDVLPGITGYTQASFRNSISNPEKRRLDAWYAQNRTLRLDIDILFKTVVAVLSRKNQITHE